MARKTKFTQADLDAMREAYENWNPYAHDAISAEELAGQFGTTKSTLYSWRAKGFRLEGRPGEGEQGWKGRSPNPPAEQDLAPVVRYLTEQLVQARKRIAELESTADGAA